MEEYLKSEKYIIYKEADKDSTNFYRQSLEDAESEPVKIYSIQNEKITYNFEGNSIKKILVYGYSELPSILHPYGFGFKESTINNFLKYKIDDSNFTSLILHDEDFESNTEDSLSFYLDEFDTLAKRIYQEQRACNDSKNIIMKNFLIEQYPGLPFSFQETNNNKSLILRNLNQKLIDQLNADDIERIGDFYIKASKKYSRPDIVKRMVKGLQKNAHVLTLQEIINKYEQLLKDSPAESVWQSFFNEYITLFDNRYYKKINDKNIALGITKYPDLVLVDIYGYIDFYELKKSNMPLLKFDNSHKTFYWSNDVSMVIAQAADYLQKAKENSVSYIKAIREQTSTENSDGIEVNIINPRAIVVAGSSKELNTIQKKNHFKNLRESLKDIEFILYDELLDRLKQIKL